MRRVSFNCELAYKEPDDFARVRRMNFFKIPLRIVGAVVLLSALVSLGLSAFLSSTTLAVQTVRLFDSLSDLVAIQVRSFIQSLRSAMPEAGSTRSTPAPAASRLHTASATPSNSSIAWSNRTTPGPTIFSVSGVCLPSSLGLEFSSFWLAPHF